MALARTELVLVTQRLAQTLGDSTGRLGCGGSWYCGWWLLPPSGHEKRNDQKFGPGICESRSGLHVTRDFWVRVKVTPGQLSLQLSVTPNGGINPQVTSLHSYGKTHHVALSLVM